MKIKSVLRLALLAGASLLACAVPASADPISVAILTTIGGTALAASTTAVALTTFALQTAAGIGLSMLGGALTKKSKPLGGSKSDIDVGTEVYRSIPFGEVQTPGRFIYYKGVGKKNKTIHLVYQLADWECEALTGVWINGEFNTLTSATVTGNEHARYTITGSITGTEIRFYRGTMTQLADTELIAASADTEGSSMGAWTANHRGAGVCYVAVKLNWDDADDNQTGFDQVPGFVWRFKGARLYDPRKDSTNGGSGAHRWATSTTWEYSDNPAICAYNFRRGFFRNGVRIAGMGDQASDLSLAHFTAAANVCDESVTVDGAPEKRYTCAVLATDEAEHRVALDAFATAMAGEWVELGGSIGIYAGASYASVATITDGDLILGESFSYTQDRDDHWNAVSCKWTNLDIEGQSDDLPLLTNSTWETADGGERLVRDIDLASVTRASQADRIARIVAEQSRMGISCTGVYRPSFNSLEPGDWVTRNFNRYGHGTVTMRVASLTRRDNMDVELRLEQCAAASYTAPTTAPVITSPGVVSGPTISTTLSGLGATSGFISSGTNKRPTIAVTWTAPIDPGVVGVDIEYRLLGNAASAVVVRSGDPESGSFTIASDVLASTDYQVRIRPVYYTGGFGTWSSYVSVTTSDQFSVVVSGIVEKAQAELTNLRIAVSDNALAAVTAALDQFDADVDAQTAINRDLLELVTRNNAVQASVETVAAAYVSADEALASQITAVHVAVDTLAAGTVFKMEATTTPAGAEARIAAYVSVDNGGTWTEAGWVLDIINTGSPSVPVYESKFVVTADQFWFLTAAGTIAPFAIVDDEIHILDMTVGGVIKSANYIAGKRGYAINQDGTIDLQDATIGGGSSTKRPFKFAYGAMQDGVFLDEPVGNINHTATVAMNTGGLPIASFTITVTGTVRRTPNTIEYDLACSCTGSASTSAPVQFSRSVTRANGSPWAGAYQAIKRYTSAPAYYHAGVRVDAEGNIYASLNRWSSALGTEYAETLMVQCISTADLDPLFEGVVSPNPYRVWKSTACNGIRRFMIPKFIYQGGAYDVVPNMADVLLWGSAGHDGALGSYGGPGGFLKCTLPVTAETMWHVCVGDVLGSGFAGQASQASNVGTFSEAMLMGGGATMIWEGPPTRDNLMAVAGGGGMGWYTVNGGCGGSTAFGGGNGSSDTDMRRCIGKTSLPNQGPAGGGGYEGGGTLSSGGGGKGGTNWAHASATAVTSSSAAENGTTGRATTQTPSGTAESVYVTYGTNPGGFANVGVATNNGKPGGGMAAIKFYRV